jgi:hypothetical protein
MRLAVKSGNWTAMEFEVQVNETGIMSLLGATHQFPNDWGIRHDYFAKLWPETNLCSSLLRRCSRIHFPVAWFF